MKHNIYNYINNKIALKLYFTVLLYLPLFNYVKLNTTNIYILLFILICSFHSPYYNEPYSSNKSQCMFPITRLAKPKLKFYMNFNKMHHCIKQPSYLGLWPIFYTLRVQSCACAHDNAR